jgi:flap endonuclease-1
MPTVEISSKLNIAMGVRNGSKVFPNDGKVTLANLHEIKDPDNAGSVTLAVDAPTEIYRCILGMKKLHALTDAQGRTSVHVMGIFNLLMQLQANNIKSVWVFDSPKGNSLKEMELAERRRRREAVALEVKAAEVDPLAPVALFTDSDKDTQHKEPSADQEKRMFKIEEWHINDVKFMLNRLGIPWVEAPKGVEAECVCAHMNVDAVLSSDMDALLFGAKTLIRRDVRRKELIKYTLDTVLETLELTRLQLVQVGIVLGTDFYKDTGPVADRLFYRIGPKTAVSKVRSGALDEKFADPRVTPAVEHFMADCPDLLPINTSEPDVPAFIDWLVDVKNFNRARISTRLRKVGLLTPDGLNA